MNYQKLIETLTFLKENRKLGSEADALVAPFKGSVCSVEFRFESMSRTFANPHDPDYEGGQTLVGDLIGTDLDFSLLLPPTENEWAESLEMGEEFDRSVKFLGFDGLYQRGIFGYVGKLEVEDADDSLRVEIEEEQISDVIEDGQILPDESPDEKPIPEKLRDEVPAKTDKLPVAGEKQEPESIPVIEPEPVEQPVDVKEETHSSTQAKDRSEKRKDLLGLLLKKPKVKKVRVSREYSKVIGRSGGGEVPPPPVEKSAKAKAKVNAPADRWEIERILDKKYEHGIESLTQEERTIYDNEQVRRKGKTKEKKRARLARGMAKEKTQRPTEPAKVEGPPGRWRLLFSFVTGAMSLNAIEYGVLGRFLFFAILSAYSLHPWVAKWMGKNPGEGLFNHRFFREKRFRRGLVLLLLAFSQFPDSKFLAFVLFIVGFFFLKDSKGFNEFLKKK
jgi:hypothetical protein